MGWWFCWTGAAEDGRAPTEELQCVWSNGFCSTGAAEDGRAPTEELQCVLVKGLLFDGGGIMPDTNGLQVRRHLQEDTELECASDRHLQPEQLERLANLRSVWSKLMVPACPQHKLYDDRALRTTHQDSRSYACSR